MSDRRLSGTRSRTSSLTMTRRSGSLNSSTQRLSRTRNSGGPANKTLTGGGGSSNNKNDGRRSSGIRAAKASAVEKLSPGKDKSASPTSSAGDEDPKGWKFLVRHEYLRLMQKKMVRRKDEIKVAWSQNSKVVKGEEVLCVIDYYKL